MHCPLVANQEAWWSIHESLEFLSGVKSIDEFNLSDDIVIKLSFITTMTTTKHGHTMLGFRMQELVN